MAKKAKKGETTDVDLTQDCMYHLSTGIVFTYVCVPASWDADKVQTERNAKGRPGTSNNEWVISEPTEENPQNPIVCPSDPSRRHWALNC